VGNLASFKALFVLIASASMKAGCQGHHHR